MISSLVIDESELKRVARPTGTGDQELRSQFLIS